MFSSSHLFSRLSLLAPIRDQARIHFHGMPPPDAPDPGPIASQGGWELGVNSLSTERQGTGSYFVVERHHKSLERPSTGPRAADTSEHNRPLGHPRSPQASLGRAGQSATGCWSPPRDPVPRPDSSLPEASARMNARLPSPSTSEPGCQVLRQKSQERLRLRPDHERPVRPRPIRRAVEGSGTGSRSECDHLAQVWSGPRPVSQAVFVDEPGRISAAFK